MKKEQWNVALYREARKLIVEGKNQQNIADDLRVSLVTVSRLVETYRGETEGHSQDPEYQAFLRVKLDNPEWGWRRIARAMQSTDDRAKMWLARFNGASLCSQTAPQPVIKNLQPYSGVDDLYAKAKVILEVEDLGQTTLAARLDVSCPVARRLRERYRGEMLGHSTDPRYQAFLVMKAQHPDWGIKRLAHKLHMPLDQARLWMARLRGAMAFQALQPSAQQASPPPQEQAAPIAAPTLWDTVNDSCRTITYYGTQVTTPAELLAQAKVDTSVWGVLKSDMRLWESRKDPRTGAVGSCYQVKVCLERQLSEGRLKELATCLAEEIKKTAPMLPAVPYKPSGTGLLFVLSMADLHIGKYSNAEETGAAYNAEIAKTLAKEATENLLGKAAIYKPEMILFVVGNDLDNVNGAQKTTANGTPQDEVGRWQETFTEAASLVIWQIERCRQLAPVHVLVVPGNHDLERAWYIGVVLKSRFRGVAGVTVDNSPAPRKYYRWGQVLLGYTHGDQEKHNQLPLIMANEQPQAWGECNCKEWHLGHWHSINERVFTPAADQGGVVVRIIPSLCAPDAWHASKGFHGRRAAEGYLYDREHGLIAQLSFTYTPPATPIQGKPVVGHNDQLEAS